MASDPRDDALIAIAELASQRDIAIPAEREVLLDCIANIASRLGYGVLIDSM